MEVIRSNEFQKQCEIYKATKKNLKSRVNNIKQVVEQNTKKEKADLERSIKAFNNKVKSIMDSDSIKKETRQIQKEEKQMFYSINKVMDIYNQAREIIVNDKSINDETKYKYLSSLEDKMLDKLYDQEEKEYFKRMVSNMIIMIPNNPKGNGLTGNGGNLLGPPNSNTNSNRNIFY